MSVTPIDSCAREYMCVLGCGTHGGNYLFGVCGGADGGRYVSAMLTCIVLGSEAV